MKSLKTIRGMLKEMEVGKISDPPPMVILKRKAIRIFPSGQRVALYRNETLNLDVSIPYFPGQMGLHQTTYASMKEGYDDEEVSLMLDESIFQSLRAIMKKNEPGTVVFANGESATVQPSTAKKLTDLHKSVNKKNKEGLGAIANSSQDFKKVVDFTTTI